MTMFERIVAILNNIVWSPALVVLLVGAGLYFTLRTRFVQVRRFGLMIRSLFAGSEKAPDGSKHGISSFEAFCVALSGRVGTGNIVGVATAIALGGPGAVFWMWIIAFFGASTAFVESTLAQQYKFHHASGYRGGPASYISKGLNAPWLGVLFSILCLLGYGTLLPSVQACRDYLSGHDARLMYIEKPGIHDYDFWNIALQDALDHFPPMQQNSD